MTPGFPATVADNVEALRRWHNERHPHTWTNCLEEPCAVLNPDFRRWWD